MQRYCCALLLFTLVLSGCRKFTETPPPDYLMTSQLVFSSDSLATAAITGIYIEMNRMPNQFTALATTLLTGLYADELFYYAPGIYEEFMAAKLSPNSHPAVSSNIWAPAYRYIYTANVCIEQLNQTTQVSPALRNSLLGEAKFIRAFCYFYLVNYFGEVPLVTSSDYRLNATLPRTATERVYRQMEADLLDAKQQLPESYSGGKRLRPTRWAAAALLARVYLYQQNWAQAETEATAVINQSSCVLEGDLHNVFLKSNTESIWLLAPVTEGWNTWEGAAILPPSPASQPTFLLTDTFLSGFETGDRRKEAWVQSRTYQGQTLYYPYKYKIYGNYAPVTEHYTVLRLAELYLLRAEARAQQGYLEAAQGDLNTIRNRAGLKDVVPTSRSGMLAAIEQERRIELAFEWGHRWFDLRRWNKADALLRQLKPVTWQSWQVNWPIPNDELLRNPFLHQNSGY